MLRSAFYPCCSRDVTEPRHILAGEVERIVFCDVEPATRDHWKRTVEMDAHDGLPRTEFVVGDAVATLSRLELVDVLFYRRDSGGEGGSGLFVLGDVFRRPLLRRFPPRGGLLVTDGSNGRGSNFKRMVRRSGLEKHGWRFAAATDQPYLAGNALWRISVTPIAEEA